MPERTWESSTPPQPHFTEGPGNTRSPGLPRIPGTTQNPRHGHRRTGEHITPRDLHPMNTPPNRKNNNSRLFSPHLHASPGVISYLASISAIACLFSKAKAHRMSDGRIAYEILCKRSHARTHGDVCRAGVNITPLPFQALVRLRGVRKRAVLLNIANAVTLDQIDKTMPFRGEQQSVYMHGVNGTHGKACGVAEHTFRIGNEE